MLLRVGIKMEKGRIQGILRGNGCVRLDKKEDMVSLAYGQYTCLVISCTWSIQSDPSSLQVPLWILFVGKEL